MSLQITLADSTTTLNLPGGLTWADEFGWTPVEQTSEYSLTGALIVQEGERQSGRPITLLGGRNAAWIDRGLALQLQALASVPEQQLTLSLWGVDYSVMFRRPAVEIEPIRRRANPGADHQYAVTINLMEIHS